MIGTFPQARALHTGQAESLQLSIRVGGGSNAQLSDGSSVSPAKHFIRLVRMPAPQVAEHCK